MMSRILLLSILIPTFAAGQSKNRSGGPSPDSELIIAETTSSEMVMPFFLSGKSFNELEALDENTGEYYALGREYIAAGRNFMSYPIPEKVLSAFNDASVLFTIYTPAELSKLPFNDNIVHQFRTITGTLYNYNKSKGVVISSDCKESDTSQAEDAFFETDLSQWIYHKSLKKSKVTRLY